MGSSSADRYPAVQDPRIYDFSAARFGNEVE